MSQRELLYEKLRSIYDDQDKKKPWTREDHDKLGSELYVPYVKEILILIVAAIL